MRTVKGLIACLAISVFVLLSITAEAGEFDEVKTKLNEARDTLTLMVRNPDKRGPDQQKLVKESAEAVSKALAGIKVSADKTARFDLLVTTWNNFRKTREEELVPLLLAGKQEEAVKLASGVQAERFSKMIELCNELAY